MKYLSFLALFTCLSFQFGFSQVKKQNFDNRNTASTIVIEKNTAKDMDILNSQFKINSIGLGQEIRITTEKDPPTFAEVPFVEVPFVEVPFAEVPFAEVPFAEVPFAEVPQDILTPKGGEIIKKTAAKEVVKEKKTPPRAVATMPRVKQKPTEIYYKGIGKSSTKKVKIKKRKLVKRKKNKRRKRRKVRCYFF
jgi:hypothetical protein